MDPNDLPQNPYILLTPGPLSTTPAVKATMLRDWCTWDDDYNRIVQTIRKSLVALATKASGYTSVLMQGSGTFSVEATLTTAVPRTGMVLVIANGAYGRRMAEVCNRCGIPFLLQDNGEVSPPDLTLLEETLASTPAISHVAVVHCETTTGMLNPVREIGKIVKKYEKTYIVDAMSSFGGIPLEMEELGADFLISSANKCIQGVPGFGFVIAREEVLQKTRWQARSLSLDLYDQWSVMEKGKGKWRFTSPTHVVRAFATALEELTAEGGVKKRHERYRANHANLITGMTRLGFLPLLPEAFHSPIITAFHTPSHPEFSFTEFYHRLKKSGFIIYPGKVTDIETFRIGNIGDIGPLEMSQLIDAVEAAMYWQHDTETLC